MWYGIIIFIIIVSLVPLGLGIMPVHYMKKSHRGIGMSYICGWFTMFALFEITVVPFIIAEGSFRIACTVYTLVLAFLLIISISLGYPEFAGWKERLAEHLSERSWILFSVVAFLLVSAQLAGAFFTQYLDGDDAYFVATSLTTQYTDTMYICNPYVGEFNGLDARHALSPVPIFMAWISNLTGIHVTVLCHSLMSIVFLALMYMIYMELGTHLFRDRSRRALFILFMTIWYMFGNVSIYTAESFAFTRTWQGKAMFPNLIVPVLFLWLIYMAEDDMDVGEWAVLFILSFASTFTTSIAVFTVPVLMLGGAALLAAKQRQLPVFERTCACLAPTIFWGMLYLFISV